MKNGLTVTNGKFCGHFAGKVSGTRLPVSSAKSTGKGSVYLIYDLKDAEDGMRLADSLRGQGYEIHTPVFDKDIILLRKYHESCLMQSDSMIILALRANNEWVHMKMVDIVKSPGLGRVRPIQCQLIIWHPQRQPADLAHLSRFEVIQYNAPDKAIRNISNLLSAG